MMMPALSRATRTAFTMTITAVMDPLLRLCDDDESTDCIACGRSEVEADSGNVTAVDKGIVRLAVEGGGVLARLVVVLLSSVNVVPYLLHGCARRVSETRILEHKIQIEPTQSCVCKARS